MTMPNAMKIDCDPGPDVEREVCRICGQVISRTRRFFRDDHLPSSEIPGWVHRECLFEEARKKFRPEK